MSKFLSKEEMIVIGYPFGKIARGIPPGNPKTEWQRTNLGICVYLPDRTGQDNNDTALGLSLLLRTERNSLPFEYRAGLNIMAATGS